MTHPTGRHFLQIPGPTNVPDRVLRAMDMPTIDHRGPEFPALTHEILAGLKRVFATDGEVVIYPSSGTGAWEAALVNTLSPGDRVLMFETGQFATQWCGIARDLGLEVEFVPGDWRSGVDPAEVEARLAADGEHAIKAVARISPRRLGRRRRRGRLAKGPDAAARARLQRDQPEGARGERIVYPAGRVLALAADARLQP